MSGWIRVVDEQDAEQMQRLARAMFEQVWRANRGRDLPADLGDRWWPATSAPQRGRKLRAA